MARKRQHGGDRTPANPAAVSGPGSMSQRTDGGPGQPKRQFPAEHQGQATALDRLQGAAPMHAEAASPASGASPPGAVPTGGPLSVFGPTERPFEPMTAGLPFGPGAGPQGPDVADADALLRVLYSILPHPELARLMTSGNDPQVGPHAR